MLEALKVFFLKKGDKKIRKEPAVAVSDTTMLISELKLAQLKTSYEYQRKMDKIYTSASKRYL